MAVMAALLLQAGCGGGEPTSGEPASAAAGAATEAPRAAGGDARRVIRPDGFPTDRPYSFGIRVDDRVYLAGQLGRSFADGPQPEGIAAQTRQAMENVGAILAADGLGHQHLVKCHVYLASMDDYQGMNEVYASFFSGRVPARTTVEAAAVPAGAGVEIACIAHAKLDEISVVKPSDGALPAPLGPYSAAVWAGDTLYVSGMGGQNPADRAVADPVPAQVTQTLANIGTTLTAAGLGFEHVVGATGYFTRPGEMDGVDGALAAPFAPGQAVRAGRVFLPRLPGPIKAELTFVAARQRDRQAFAPAVTAPDAGTDVESQARAVFDRLKQDIEQRGLAWADVVSVQVYLADLGDMSVMDTVYRELFPSAPPARTTIQAQLPEGARVQVGALAAR